MALSVSLHEHDLLVCLSPLSTTCSPCTLHTTTALVGSLFCLVIPASDIWVSTLCDIVSDALYVPLSNIWPYPVQIMPDMPPLCHLSVTPLRVPFIPKLKSLGFSGFLYKAIFGNRVLDEGITKPGRGR